MFKNFTERSKNLISQIGLNIIFKGGSVLIGFFYVPLSIKVLGLTDYGLWLALFSFVNFFYFFDFGLGHGLRNYLTIALSKNNINEAKILTSTAYVTLLSIGVISIICFLILFRVIPWLEIFNVPLEKTEVFLTLAKFIFVIFFINLTLKLIEIVSYANLKPSIPGLLTFINHLVSFIVISFLFYVNNSSLLNYGLTILLVQLLVLFSANVIFFRSSYNRISPSIHLFNFRYAKKIFGLGGKFFIIQIAALILYSTDNIIIIQIFSPSDVTIYNIAYKYFAVFTMLSSLILTPYWSAITEAQALDDNIWIKSNMNRALFIVSILSLVAIFFYIFSKPIYGLWVGKNINIPISLSLAMTFFVISAMYLQVFSMYLNGVGAINLQLKVGVFCSIINIPLSVILAKYLGMGISGVILATLVCNLITLCFLPFQYFKHINSNLKIN